MVETSGYNRAVVITKSDTVNFEFGTCDALYVGGAGIVIGVFDDNSTVNLTAVAGAILPFRFKRVNSTTTSATLMAACYRA